MPAPTFSLSVTGTDPKSTSKQILEDAINETLSALYDFAVVAQAGTPEQLEIIEEFESVRSDAVAASVTSQGAASDAEAARDLAETYAGVDHRAATWAELSAISGLTGEVGYVGPDDTGTHTDPVATGTVANEGVYTWAADGLGSAQAERTASTGLVLIRSEIGAVKDSTPVDSSGYSAKIEDADGRVFMAFDGEGMLTDSHDLVTDMHNHLAIKGTQEAVYHMPLIRTTAASYYDWNGVSVMGQSNAVGNNSGPITTTQAFNNKELSGSVLVDLVETEVESPLSSATAHGKWRVLKDMRPWDSWAVDYDFIGNQMGAANTAFAGIKKGTLPYNNGLSRVSTVNDLATTAGKTFAECALPFLHGENDSKDGTTQATYLAEMIGLKDDWNADVSAITGQSNRIPMFVVQVAISDNGSVSTNKDPVRAMLEAAETDDEIFVVVPGYAFTFAADGLHYSAYDERMIGEYIGKAIHRYWIEGRDPSTVRPLSWKIIDPRTIEVGFYVPVPPLVFDLDYVWPIDEGLGFAVYQAGGAEIPISSVRIVGNTVRITTSSDVVTGDTITYAEKVGVRTKTGGLASGRRKGARGNLRDSDATIAFYPDRYGNPIRLPNWSVSFNKVLS